MTATTTRKATPATITGKARARAPRTGRTYTVPYVDCVGEPRRRVFTGKNAGLLAKAFKQGCLAFPLNVGRIRVGFTAAK